MYLRGGKAPPTVAKALEQVINLNAKVLDKRVMLNPETGGYRAFFKLDITPDVKLLEMTCDLVDGKKPISERWSYQWKR